MIIGHPKIAYPVGSEKRRGQKQNLVVLDKLEDVDNLVFVVGGGFDQNGGTILAVDVARVREQSRSRDTDQDCEILSEQFSFPIFRCRN